MSSSLEAAEAAGRETTWTRDARRMARAQGRGRARLRGSTPRRVRRATLGRARRGTSTVGRSPFDFTTFGELGEIIKTNWDLFGSVFSSPKAVERVMANLNTLRGPVAHCS